MALSRKERLKRKAEREKLRRRKLFNDEARLAEHNRKRREKYAKNDAVRQERRQNMSKRDIRDVRRQWKLAKREERLRKKSAERTSGSKNIPHQVVSGAQKRKKNTKRHYYVVRKLELKIDQLKTRVAKYRKRYQRLVMKTAKFSNSPSSKLNREFRNEKISPRVRRKLLFAESLQADLRSSYRSLKSKKIKQIFTSTLSLKYTAKYRFMSRAKPFFPWNANVKKQKFGVAKKSVNLVRETVIEFFQSDDVSTQAPGKKDCITFKKKRKQKRYLNNSLLFLHRKFCDENPFVVSYTTFCRMKPFWVLNRKVDERDTCLCISHENMDLITKRMKEEKILSTSCIDQLIGDEMCCEKKDAPNVTDCLFRKCDVCSSKMIVFNEFEDEEETHYDRWEKVMEVGRDKKAYKRTTKVRVKCQTHELVDKFHEMLPAYMIHIGNIRHQYATIKELKKNLTMDDLLLHVDFSENYACKWTREIQSCHFGGNRLQITLHTSVLYI